MTVPLAPWPDPASALGKPFFAVAGEIKAAFKWFGAPYNVMLGFVARAELESAFKLVAGDDGKAHGRWQWHADRIDDIKVNTGIDINAGLPPYGEVAAIWWELHAHPYLGLAQIMAAATPTAAGQAVCKFFERAGAADAVERTGLASDRWDAYWGIASY